MKDGARGERHAARHWGGSPRSAWLAGTITVLLSLIPADATPSLAADGPLGTLEDDEIVPEASETVLPSVETDPSHHPGDTADDMAIWIHPTDPSRSLVIGDDKGPDSGNPVEGGLMVWDLDGDELQYVEGTLYNNVDLRYNFPLVGTFDTGESHTTVALVGVSDQGERQFDFFKVNPYARRLEPVGGFDVSLTPYGGCMYLSVTTGTYYFIAPTYDGRTEQWEVYDGGAGQVAGRRARTFSVGSITEGCVADDLLGHLYMGEERRGIWKYGAEPEAGNARTLVDSTNASEGGNLVPDVEGLSIYYAGPSLGYLFATNQGESTVGVYTREGANEFLGKFRVEANGTIDRVRFSDGLDVSNFPLGSPFGAGLFAIHDSNNTGAVASNVKFVSYAALASALGLLVDTTWDPRLVGAPGPPPPPPPFDFAVSVDPAAGSVEPGGSVDVTATATRLSGSPQTVTFSCEDLPAGATCDFRPARCTPTCDASLSLQTDSTTPEGIYSVSVQASSGTVTRSAIFLLTVDRPPPPPFDFSLALDPTSATVEPGGSVDVRVDATLVSGSPNDVIFMCEGLPAGATCEFTPPACAPTCGVALVLATDPGLQDGTYTVDVTGSDGSVSRTEAFTLTVTTPPPPFDFLLAVNPATGSVEPGGSVSPTVIATLVSGSPSEVAFACEDLPAEASCTFAPPACTPTCEVSLTLMTSSGTPDGTYAVGITGSDGTIHRTTVFRLTVTTLPPPFDFAVAVDPTSGSTEPGGSVSATVTATLVSGSPHIVAFTCEDLPAGAACTFVPPACSPTCSVGLTLATSRDTPDGVYAVAIHGSDGTITRIAVLRLTVASPPLPFDFALALDPTSATVERGDSFNITVNATLDSGQTHQVRFECRDLPSGTSCTFAPPSCDPTCRAILLLSTNSSTPEGTYAVDVVGSNGTITRSASFVLTVVGPPPPPPVATSLVLDPEAPDPSRPAEEVKVSAVLTRDDPGGPVAGRSVVFEVSEDGGTTWKPAGMSHTDEVGRANGTVAFLDAGESRIRARFDGDAEFAGSISGEELHTTREDDPLPDTTPPTISIATPANGSTVTDPLVTFSGTAEDDRDVVAVELSLDGSTWVRASGTTTWTATLSLAGGTHTLYVRATDSSENRLTVVIELTVDPPGDPPVDPPSPTRSGGDLLLALPAVQGTLFAMAMLAAMFALVLRRRRLPPSTRLPPKSASREEERPGEVDPPDGNAR